MSRMAEIVDAAVKTAKEAAACSVEVPAVEGAQLEYEFDETVSCPSSKSDVFSELALSRVSLREVTVDE